MPQARDRDPAQAEALMAEQFEALVVAPTPVVVVEDQADERLR